MDTNSKESAATMQTYQISNNVDTMLLFYEDSKKIIAKLSMTQIPVQNMLDLILQHQYLALPRLSSQDVFDGN